MWTDANQNGVGGASELQTFADLGVSAISFSIALTGAGASNVYDNTVLGSSQVNYSAGGSTQIHDVALARRLAHIGGFIAGVWRSEWASYDADADGDFGVGRTTAQLSPPEDALADLAQIFLNTAQLAHPGRSALLRASNAALS